MNTHHQDSPHASPWSREQQISILLWQWCWIFFCAWTPKPFNAWRIFVLKQFGAKIHGKPFVHQKARIQIPWNLTLHDRACLGDGANAYSLGEIEIHEHATIAQEAYLCTGSHAFQKRNMNLITAKITIEAHAFVGARAFIMPGLTIGREAVIGAVSVVTKNVSPNTIFAGNPARQIGVRFIEDT